MAGRTLPNLGLEAFFALGEDGWDDEVNLNFLKLSILAQAGAISKVAATPAMPAAGDVHIFDETHPTQANTVAVFDDGIWKYFTPLQGWLIYNRGAAAFELFSGTVWAPVVFGSGVPDAPADGNLYARRDNAWESFVPGGGGGGGSSWSTLLAWDFTVDGNLLQPVISGITANEILVIFDRVILSTAPPTAGAITPALLVSTDNGATFIDTTNAYLYPNVNNIEAGDSYLRATTATSTSVRSSFISICNAQGSSMPKFAQTNGDECYMPTILAPINAIRVQGRSTPAVTFVAGKIWVLAR